MNQFLNLLAAIALLVWGTHLVRSGILQVFGESLRRFLAHGINNRFVAAASGVGVTVVLQSSTATALIVSAFVGQGMVTLPLALAVMLGADIGTSVMAVAFSMDLSWLSPLLILVGVVMFISRQHTSTGRVGRVLIGLGLMLLALRMVSLSAAAMTQSPVIKPILAAVGADTLLLLLVGAVMTVVAYSSLAIVLLTAGLVASGAIPLLMGLGLVLGANLGSGMLAVITTAKAAPQVRHVPLGNLAFKVIGVLIVAPLIGSLPTQVLTLASPASTAVFFHLAFNVLVGIVCIGMTGPVARLVERILPVEQEAKVVGRPRHLDPSALDTPSLALTCAVREALHQTDVVETMMRGLQRVLEANDRRAAQEVRSLDDTVDELHSAIKYYLTKLSHETLSEEEGKRWSEVISFTINMEQIGDAIERMLQDVEVRMISKDSSFSPAGRAEISELLASLMANLRLGTSVFLTRRPREAQRLLEEKARFRELERRCATAHLMRLADSPSENLELSSLHIDLMSDFRRINSLVCLIAYPIQELSNATQAGKTLGHAPLRELQVPTASSLVNTSS